MPSNRSVAPLPSFSIAVPMPCPTPSITSTAPCPARSTGPWLPAGERAGVLAWHVAAAFGVQDRRRQRERVDDAEQQVTRAVQNVGGIAHDLRIGDRPGEVNRRDEGGERHVLRGRQQHEVDLAAGQLDRAAAADHDVLAVDHQGGRACLAVLGLEVEHAADDVHAVRWLPVGDDRREQAFAEQVDESLGEHGAARGDRDRPIRAAEEGMQIGAPAGQVDRERRRPWAACCRRPGRRTRWSDRDPARRA